MGNALVPGGLILCVWASCLLLSLWLCVGWPGPGVPGLWVWLTEDAEMLQALQVCTLQFQLLLSGQLLGDHAAIAQASPQPGDRRSHTEADIWFRMPRCLDVSCLSQLWSMVPQACLLLKA